MEEDGLSSDFSTFSPILSSQSHQLQSQLQSQLPSQHLQSQQLQFDHVLDHSLDQTLELQSQQIQTQLESHLLNLSSQQQLPEPSTALILTSSSSSAGPSSASAPPLSETRGRSRQPSTRRRTKLSSQERAKILEVRRQRACLRCKMLKIQCSKENPCKPCLSSAVRGYERKVLSFCYCVRTRFADVDIFQRSESGPPPEIPPSIKALMDQVERPILPPGAVEEPSSSSSASSATPSSSSTPSAPATATHDVFEDTLLRWLTSPDHAPPDGTGSIVALLYDLVGHADSLRAAVDDRLPADFQTFLFTTSLAHTGWRGGDPHVTHRDLCIAGHVCGSRIVRRLDRILTPQFLAKCDRATHRALLLLVFGVILGVSYSTRLTTSPSFPHDLLGAEMRHSPTLWLAMKEHLAQMLAHHLIFLGSTLGIKLDTAAEKTIIDTAVDRWHKPERSLWAGFSGASLNPSTRTPTATPMQIPVSLSDDSLARLGDFNSLDTLPAQYHDHTRPRTIGSPPLSRSLPTSLSTVATTPASASVSAAATATATAIGSPSMMSRMARMSIVALSDPDLLELQAVPPMSDDDYSANPESFYSMDTQDVPSVNMPLVGTGPADLDASGGLAHPHPGGGPGQPGRMGDPNDGGPPHTRKKRSVWIVRPFDDGGHRDPVSVFARFQLQRGQNLGLFV